MFKLTEIYNTAEPRKVQDITGHPILSGIISQEEWDELARVRREFIERGFASTVFWGGTQANDEADAIRYTSIGR